MMSKGYSVTFTVTDGQNAIEGATITFNSSDLTSDANGNVAYADVIDGSYDYSVSMTGYITSTGSITVSGADVSESVVLTAVYNVKFSVTDGSTPLVGATITLNSVESITDAAGEANYADLVDGVYSYTVTLSGYFDVSGSVTVAGEDILEDIFMDIILGFENLNQNSNISFYPNPVTNKINIDFSSAMDKLTVVIISMAGKKTYLGDFVNQSNLQLDLSAFDSGIYLLKIISADKVSTARIIIE